jgi:hypothetical protein
MRSEPPRRVKNRVVQAGSRLRGAQPLLVGFNVGKVQRVGGAQPAVHQLIARLQQQIDPLPRADLEVMLTAGADIQVSGEIGLPNRRFAAHALDPQTLGAHTRLCRAPRAGTVLLTLEPGHSTSLFSFQLSAVSFLCRISLSTESIDCLQIADS